MIAIVLIAMAAGCAAALMFACVFVVLARREQRLARDAADVHAHATELVSLNHGGGETELRRDLNSSIDAYRE